jgi:hypothetical protein
MNYYATKVCPCCATLKSFHLGKSSAGWTFTFKGSREAGVVDYASWLDRLTTLTADGYTITSDGEDIGNGLPDLLAKIESKKNEKNNHTTYLADNDYPLKENWLDADGNSFSDYEFS